MKPKITKIGPEESCGAFSGSRPSIAVDSKNLPHIIIDQGTSKDLYIFHKINNAWSQSLFARGDKNGKYKASRIFLPHIEIDNKDRAWISCKFGTKEWGSMKGQGLWLINNITTNSNELWFRNIVVGKGNANVSLNKLNSNSGVILGSSGKWQEIKEDGSTGSGGQIKLGPSGEKVRFLISTISATESVWHAVMCGYDQTDSFYGYKKGTKLSNTPWADKNKYTDMGSDMIHPSIGIDIVNPNICYMSVVYSVGVIINIFDGSKMLFPKDNLKVVSAKGHTGPDRFGPQWAPALNGGAYLTWIQDGSIMMTYVGQDGSLTDLLDGNKPRTICNGNTASICTDANGDVHLAYVNGGMKYRKIEMLKDPSITTTTTTEDNTNTTTTEVNTTTTTTEDNTNTTTTEDNTNTTTTEISTTTTTTTSVSHNPLKDLLAWLKKQLDKIF